MKDSLALIMLEVVMLTFDADPEIIHQKFA